MLYPCLSVDYCLFKSDMKHQNLGPSYLALHIHFYAKKGKSNIIFTLRKYKCLSVTCTCGA